jgi:lipoprotein-releasing system permease protein
MKVSTYIARRFMLGGRGAGASRFTGWIAIIGMALGCLALILSVAVLNGFEAQVTDRIIGFEGDLRLTNLPRGAELESLLRKLTTVEQVRLVMPYMERKGLLTVANSTPRMVRFKAVAYDTISHFYRMNIQYGDQIPERPPVMIGQLLANRFTLGPGDEVRLLSPIDSPLQFGLPRFVRAEVGAVFRAEVLDFDDRVVFIPYRVGRQLFTRKPGFDGIDLRLSTPESVPAVRERIATFLPPGVKLESWAELHEGLFHAMRMEHVGAIVILSLVVLVAAFNLTSTLVLVIYQKIRQIGILRTLGATTGTIRRVVLKQGVFLGAAGAVTGLSIGLVLVWVQIRFGILPLPSDIYLISTVPMKLKTVDLVVIPSIALILILAAAFIAARRALAIIPRQAIQLEK